MFKRISMVAMLTTLLVLILTACGEVNSTPLTATTTAASTTATGGVITASTVSSTDGLITPDICPKPGTTTWTGEVKIGVGGPYTGASAGLGLSIQRGTEMAIDDINSCGGIAGKKLTAVYRDDKAKPDVGLTNWRDLIDTKDIVGLIGTANTAVGLVQAPVVNQSKIPWIDSVATDTKVTQDTTATPNYVFRISMVDALQTKFVADAVLAKYKKVAIIHDETVYGTLGRDDIVTALSSKGVTALMDETYKVGWSSDDMKPVINKVKASGAEVVINWGLGAEAANLRIAMKDLGVDIPFYGSWSMSMPIFQQNAGGLENGAIQPQSISVDTTTAKQKEFFAKYLKKYNTNTVGFPSGLGQSYDATWIMALAMIRNPGVESDRTKLRDAIVNFGSFAGVIKNYDKPFASNSFEALTVTDFLMTTWKDGKIIRLDTK